MLRERFAMVETSELRWAGDDWKMASSYVQLLYWSVWQRICIMLIKVLFDRYLDRRKYSSPSLLQGDFFPSHCSSHCFLVVAFEYQHVQCCCFKTISAKITYKLRGVEHKLDLVASVVLCSCTSLYDLKNSLCTKVHQIEKDWFCCFVVFFFCCLCVFLIDQNISKTLNWTRKCLCFKRENKKKHTSQEALMKSQC